jgi:hypothetical protein
MFNLQNLQVLLEFFAFAAVLLCTVLALVGFVRLFHFSKAEQHLTHAMVDLAKRKQLVPVLKNAFGLRLKGQEPSAHAKKEFSALLQEALSQLQAKERRVIMAEGIHQPSAQGRKNYEFKLMAQTLKRAGCA